MNAGDTGLSIPKLGLHRPGPHLMCNPRLPKTEARFLEEGQRKRVAELPGLESTSTTRHTCDKALVVLVVAI